MGLRSTLISEHYTGSYPEWLKEKYNDKILFIDGTLIASKCEFKIYENSIFEDIQKGLIETGFFDEKEFPFGIVVMDEETSVSKVLITKNDIKYIKFITEHGFESDSVW